MALQKSRSKEEAEYDLNMMTKLVANKESATAKTGRTSIWQKHYLLPFTIAFAVACLTQLTGINVFLQLCTLILHHSGLHSSVISMLGSVGIGIMNFIVTIIAMMLVDKLGRKPLVILGTSGLVIALFYLGIVAKFLSPGNIQGYLMIAGFILFIIFYAIGPGVVVWLAISELMPTAIRGKGMAICLFANCLTSTILAAVFLQLVNFIGYAGVFWICGGFTLIYLLIAIFLLPETKNKSLEEIEAFFKAKVA